MAKDNSGFPFGSGSGGAIRSIANPRGVVAPINQPSWGDRTPKPDGAKPAPATGPVVGSDTKGAPIAQAPCEDSVAASDAPAESPNDEGQEE